MDILLACPHSPETSGSFTFVFLFASLGNKRARHQAFKLGLYCSILLQCDEVIMASSVELSPFWPLGSTLILVWHCSNELSLFPLWAEWHVPPETEMTPKERHSRTCVGSSGKNICHPCFIPLLGLHRCQYLCGSGQARLQENNKKKTQ